jgi:hypothetical protein
MGDQEGYPGGFPWRKSTGTGPLEGVLGWGTHQGVPWICPLEGVHWRGFPGESPLEAPRGSPVGGPPWRDPEGGSVKGSTVRCSLEWFAAGCPLEGAPGERPLRRPHVGVPWRGPLAEFSGGGPMEGPPEEVDRGVPWRGTAGWDP